MGNATLADLLAALEETSGRDLAAWSAEWLQTAGVNTLRPSYSLGADGRFIEFAVEQEAPATHPVLRSHRIAIGLYDRTQAGLVRRYRVEIDVAGPRTLVPELAGQPRPDLVLVNDDDLSYAKIRLDDHSLRTLVGPDKGGPGGRGGLGGKVSPQDRGDPGGSPPGAAPSPRASTYLPRALMGKASRYRW